MASATPSVRTENYVAFGKKKLINALSPSDQLRASDRISKLIVKEPKRTSVPRALAKQNKILPMKSYIKPALRPNGMPGGLAMQQAQKAAKCCTGPASYFLKKHYKKRLSKAAHASGIY
jgi:hypothetical protein